MYVLTCLHIILTFNAFKYVVSTAHHYKKRTKIFCTCAHVHTYILVHTYINNLT